MDRKGLTAGRNKTTAVWLFRSYCSCKVGTGRQNSEEMSDQLLESPSVRQDGGEQHIITLGESGLGARLLPLWSRFLVGGFCWRGEAVSVTALRVLVMSTEAECRRSVPNSGLCDSYLTDFKRRTVCPFEEREV